MSIYGKTETFLSVERDLNIREKCEVISIGLHYGKQCPYIVENYTDHVSVDFTYTKNANSRNVFTHIHTHMRICFYARVYIEVLVCVDVGVHKNACSCILVCSCECRATHVFV